MRRFITILAIMTCMAAGAAPTDSLPLVNYVPTVGGVLRARWEMLTDGGENRFAVRNARVNIKGNVARNIDYYFQADLCSNGKMMFLDGWGRIKLIDALAIKAGRFRVPFGVDPFRGPATYIFSNRSFIARDMLNMRSIGVSAAYSLPWVPVNLEAGIFNNTSSLDNNPWTHSKAFASKATVSAGYFSIAAGYVTLCPDKTRINMADAGVTFTCGRVIAEAEYMYKHYTSQAFDAAHAYNLFLSYNLPVKVGVFNNLSVQGRADGITDHSDRSSDSNGLLTTNMPACNRLTLGTTLTYKYKRLRCDFRINYENYFYKNNHASNSSRNDCLSAELVVAF